ncbi:carboxypeptidase-like regulatory domain-containing protein [Neolewinella litorea]|uniref:Uncharacterized protein n=1 Tax=Neolewinella litorea TaxID=2562452 RepID=A0A4S4N906_9BACT|nr:carboxypeptidase-like regulatory domain-containing protein [Neolewinella litorea]THH34548.1 hypothetical protein E4021_17635 [Neolewinella litorea]
MIAAFFSSCAFQKKGMEKIGRYISTDYMRSEEIHPDSILLSGYVYSAQSLSALPNATVRFGDARSGVLAGANGYFKIMVSARSGKNYLLVDNTGNRPLKIVSAGSKGGSVKRYIILLGSSITYDMSSAQ